jgi:hypothetical protein
MFTGSVPGSVTRGNRLRGAGKYQAAARGFFSVMDAAMFAVNVGCCLRSDVVGHDPF